MKSSNMNIWMQLLGFERNDPDCGVERFIKQTGFVPGSVCALLFHPDFVNLHRGMDEEYELLRANCAYYGIPGNGERARQPWTNYNLRTLISELKKRGVPFYAGLMGIYSNNLFHHEWLSDHPEIRGSKTIGEGSLMCLKRFADGTYYEDFFVKKLCETLIDYDCAGVHLSDGICPSTRVFVSDYSTDMCGQFTDHTGFEFPEDIAATFGDESLDARKVRASYIQSNIYEKWLGFYEWRWEAFFKKVCSAVHAIGKEVHILGMYCTDPFETRFLYGFDMRRVFDAGVDCMTANILPSGLALNKIGAPPLFHRIHLDLPFVRAQVPYGRIPAMVGVQDASEEWSVIEHRPVMLERDLYTVGAFLGKGDDLSEPAGDGYFLCLSDGIPADKWDFLRDRVARASHFEAEKTLSPIVLWSNTETDRMIGEFIRNRRTSCHKQATDVFQMGTPFGGAIPAEKLPKTDNPIFAPNVDLISDEERDALRAYPHPWVGTAPVGYDVSAFNPTFVCTDRHSDFPMQAFMCGLELTDSEKEKINTLLDEDDGRKSEAQRPMYDVNPLSANLPFVKLSSGFAKACGAMLTPAVQINFPVASDVPMLAIKLKNGHYRIYLYNPFEHHYSHAMVTSAKPILSADIISAFPVLPVRFVASVAEAEIGGNRCAFDHEKISTNKNYSFRTKFAPGGVTVIEMKLED